MTLIFLPFYVSLTINLIRCYMKDTLFTFINITPHRRSQGCTGCTCTPNGRKNWGGGFPGKGFSAQRAPQSIAIKEFNLLRDLDGGSG